MMLNEAKDTGYFRAIEQGSRTLTLVDDVHDGRFAERVVEWDVDHTVEVTCQGCGHPLERHHDEIRRVISLRLTSTLFTA